MNIKNNLKDLAQKYILINILIIILKKTRTKVRRMKKKIINIFNIIVVNLFYFKQFKILKYIINNIIKLEIRNFDSYYNIVKKANKNIKQIYQLEKEVHYCNPQYSDDKINNSIKNTNYKEYGCIYNNVDIIGSSNLILYEDKAAVYETASNNSDNDYEYIDKGIKYYIKDTCFIRYKDNDNMIDCGILLSGNFSQNYYHLLFEIITKFYQIEKANIDKNIPLIVDEVCFNVKQFNELIEVFNTIKREIIYIKSGKRYSVNKLYYFSNPNFVPPHYRNCFNIKSSDCFFDFKTLSFLRKKLISNKLNKNLPKRIFLSRKNAGKGRTFNEKEVIELLKKYDFEVIYPEYYTISEQIAMFNNAEIIAGGSGAAFTNIVFCNSDCKILCFINYKYQGSFYSTIAKYVEAEMVYFYDKNKKMNSKSTLHDSFTIDIKELKQDIKKYLN